MKPIKKKVGRPQKQVIKFKVGDRVVSEQPGLKYTGTITNIFKDEIIVSREKYKYGLWSCMILPDGKVATANGVWDQKSYLKLATNPQGVGENTEVIKISEFFKIKNKSNVYILVSKDVHGNLIITNNKGESEFSFTNSKPEMVKVIGELLIKASEI